MAEVAAGNLLAALSDEQMPSLRQSRSVRISGQPPSTSPRLPASSYRQNTPPTVGHRIRARTASVTSSVAGRVLAGSRWRKLVAGSWRVDLVVGDHQERAGVDVDVNGGLGGDVADAE